MSHDHGDEPSFAKALVDKEETMKKKESAWLEQQEITDRLNKQGAEEFFSPENFPEINSIFVETKEKLCCIDEGVFNIEDKSRKMALAGSGILFPANSWQERLNRVAELCINRGIKDITSHEGCGAAGLAWQNDGGETDTGFKSADEYGKKWSKELSHTINQKLAEADKTNDVKYQHVNKSEMIRPPEFHDARAIWFDLTSKFHPDAAKRLPKGFLIDYGITRDEGKNEEEKGYSFTELKVAVGIAFGDHGFGNKFTTENKFIIVVISEDESELANLKQEIANKIKEDKNLKTHFDKIKIDGFVKK